VCVCHDDYAGVFWWISAADTVVIFVGGVGKLGRKRLLWEGAALFYDYSPRFDGSWLEALYLVQKSPTRDPHGLS